MAMSASFFITMFSPTLHSQGVGRRRSRRDGALAGDRPDTGGAPRDGTWKAWPLLCSAGSHPLGTHLGGRDDGMEPDPEQKRMGTGLAGVIGDTELLMKYETVKDVSEQLRIKPATIYGW